MIKDEEKKVIDISPILCIERTQNLKDSSSYTVKYILKFFDGSTKPIDIVVEDARDKEDAILKSKEIIDKGIQIFCSGVDELKDINEY